MRRGRSAHPGGASRTARPLRRGPVSPTLPRCPHRPLPRPSFRPSVRRAGRRCGRSRDAAAPAPTAALRTSSGRDRSSSRPRSSPLPRRARGASIAAGCDNSGTSSPRCARLCSASRTPASDSKTRSSSGTVRWWRPRRHIRGAGWSVSRGIGSTADGITSRYCARRGARSSRPSLPSGTPRCRSAWSLTNRARCARRARRSLAPSVYSW